MKRAIAAVIGHVDHGKTTLVRALTGTDTDRLAEEKQRGISIALGFAHLADDPASGTGAPARASDLNDGGGIDLIDVPGHERFVRTMVAGASGLDFVLLVVEAREGVRPQTREHLAIVSLLGVGRAVLALTKSDLADADRAAEVEREAVAAAQDAGLEVAARVRTAAATGGGVQMLAGALRTLRDALPEGEDNGLPFLPVDRAFSVAGHGTVVTGTLRGGPIAVGDTLEVAGAAGKEVRVRSLQTHGLRVAHAAPGRRVAVNLRGIAREEVPAGSALAPPGALVASAWLGVSLRATGGDVATGARLLLLIGTVEREVRVRLLDRDVLAAGDTAPAQLRLAQPVAVPARQRFVLRVLSPAATVGGGTVIEPEGHRARRLDPGVLERFALRSAGDRRATLADAVRRANRGGVALAALARLAGCGEAIAAGSLGADTVVLRGGLAVGAEALRAVETGLRLALARAPDGLAREALSRLLPSAGAAVLDEALARLAARGDIRRKGALFSVPDPARDQARATADARALTALAATLRGGGLSPPDLPGDPRHRRLLDALLRKGTAVRARDRVQERDIFFHTDAIGEARRRLSPQLDDPRGLSVSEAGALLGISRKFSVPLLEHLDAVGFTRREGDRRRRAEEGGGSAPNPAGDLSPDPGCWPRIQK